MAPPKFNPVLIDLKHLAPKALDPKRAQMAPNKFNSIPKYLKDFFPKTLDLKSPQMAPFKIQFITHIHPTFVFKNMRP
jgi:hypothetical protein